MKIIEIIKEYVKNPKYIIWDLESNIAGINKKLISGLYKKIHKYEFEYIENPIIDDYRKRTEGMGLLSPMVTVYKVIENHFGFDCTFRMKIHNLIVETQDKKQIDVTISLVRPGLIIGREGKDIDAIQKHLERIFDRKVAINIFEVKNDKNEPFRFSFY